MVAERLKIVAILQARMGSSRFPGKVLADIVGKPLIMHIIERIRAAKKIDGIILATTQSRDDDEMENFAEKSGIHCYRGEVDDVLSRFYGAATKYKASVIVRICCDDPLIDQKMLDDLLDLHFKTHADYTSTSHERTYPVGVEAEVFNYDILEKAFNCANKEYEREHVTPYIYEHPELFKIRFIEAKKKIRRPELRLTVDTQEDFYLVREIFENLYKKDQLFYTEDVIDFLDSHPELLSVNSLVHQKKLGD
jgi:spore coat polysaccharide biosynthesis protein SpsF